MPGLYLKVRQEVNACLPIVYTAQKDSKGSSPTFVSDNNTLEME